MAEAPRYRCYGRRQRGRLRPNRKALIEQVLPALTVPLGDAGTLKPASLFPEPVASTWLEIGFGSGEHLVAQIRDNPHIGFLGCEPFVHGVGAFLARLPVEHRPRTRVLADDARLLLDALEPASIERVYLLFPDPWPKRRHAKRRFIQSTSLDQLARVMRQGACLRFASDHPVCQHWALRLLLDDSRFRWTARRPVDFLNPPDDWHDTRYQTRHARGSADPLFLEFIRA